MGTVTIGKDNIALEKKKQSALAKAVKRVKKDPEGKSTPRNVERYRRGIIMLKHVPHGFYEKEMRGYFSQFGRVLRIRVARSEKTGKSRGYAFVEFEFEEVAKIAAEAMNNYLMFERLIKCELLPPQVKSRNIFQDRHIREDNYPKLKSREHNTTEQNRIMTREQVEDVMEQRQKKIQDQNKRFAEMGVDYHFQVPTKGDCARASDTRTAAEKTRADLSTSAATTESEPELRKSVGSQEGRKMPTVERIDARKTPVTKSKDSPTASPNLARNRQEVGKVVEEECLDDAKPSPAAKGKLQLPRISPKVLRSRKSQGGNGNILVPESRGAEKTPAASNKDLPRISPKLLRSSRKSVGANVAEKDGYDGKKTPARLSKELPRVSPKLLRSRKSHGVAPLLGRGSADLSKTPTSSADKRKDLPRISPKLLRSRKSDASALTPLLSKAAPSTPSKQKKPTRKSVF